MAVCDARVFPGFLTPVLTQLFFPKPPTTFLTCFCRGERRKYSGKKVRLNRKSNSQPPGHESDTLTTEPLGRGSIPLNRIVKIKKKNIFKPAFRLKPIITYMPHFDALKLYSCRKHCEKKRNCFKQAIYPVLTMFSTLYGTYFFLF